jgi:hypothetical protein
MTAASVQYGANTTNRRHGWLTTRVSLTGEHWSNERDGWRRVGDRESGASEAWAAVSGSLQHAARLGRADVGVRILGQ